MPAASCDAKAPVVLNDNLGRSEYGAMTKELRKAIEAGEGASQLLHIVRDLCGVLEMP